MIADGGREANPTVTKKGDILFLFLVQITVYSLGLCLYVFFRVAGGGGALLPPPTQLFWTLSRWTHVSSHKTTQYELEYLKLCGNVQKKIEKMLHMSPSLTITSKDLLQLSQV